MGGLLTAAWPGLALAATRQVTPILQKHWATGNRLLAPLTRQGQKLLFAGDCCLGVIRPHDDQVVWTAKHGFSGEAVFRPRSNGDSVISGGLAELGAWRLRDGKPLWLYKADIQMGVPWVDEQVTYVGDGSTLLALDNLDGTVRWRHASTADTLMYYAPVVAFGTVMSCSGDGVLYALSARNGEELWRLDRSAEWQYLRQLHVTGNTLVAGSYHELLYGIAIDSGKVLWTFGAGNFINSHHVAGNSAYLWSPTGWVYAIDVRNGQVRWRHRTTNYSGSTGQWAPMMAELMTQGEYLFALDMSNVLHILSTETGEEVQRIALSQNLRPTVVPWESGQVLVATADGDVLLFQL